MKTIRELREQRGWSQFDLAKELDVSPSTIYNWERGKFEPRIKQLRDLARVFGVRMDDITVGIESGGEAPKVAA